MKKAYKKVVVVIFVLIILVLGSVISWPFLSRAMVGVHMKGITIELHDWSVLYQTVDSRTKADHAIDMLDYIEHYYAPGRGYRSFHKTEQKLLEQRKETIETIVKALQEYTGATIGTDPKAWDEWRDGQGWRDGLRE